MDEFSDITVFVKRTELTTPVGFWPTGTVYMTWGLKEDQRIT